MNKNYQHKYLSNLSCEVESETRKGFKVKQKEKVNNKKAKETIQYYQHIDFDKDKGLWIASE